MTEIRNLTDLAEYAQDQIDRITRMQRDLADHEGEGESPRGLVRARTGPGGALRDLHLTPDVLRLSPDEASAEITAAITAAQQDYATRADAIMQPVLGMKPSEQSTDVFDAGMQRLDALTADLDRLVQRRDNR
jgi:DNA-binding protein YbaB